jgi:hypothetical protein
MNEETLFRFAGWSAYFNAAIFILSMIALMLFFSIGGIWGRINDSLSILWMLSYLPLAVALYLINRADNATLSLIASLVGSAAALTFVTLQFLLVIGRVRFEQTFSAVLIMTALVGIFVLIQAFLARSSNNLPPGLTWIMILYGIASVVGAIGFQIGGEQHPLAMIGLLLNAISGIVWVIWFGRLLLAKTVVSAMAAVT